MDKSPSQAVKLVIRKKEGLLDIMSLINGKFRTLKINTLYSLIDYIHSDLVYSKLNQNLGKKFYLIPK